MEALLPQDHLMIHEMTSRFQGFSYVQIVEANSDD